MGRSPGSGVPIGRARARPAPGLEPASLTRGAAFARPPYLAGVAGPTEDRGSNRGRWSVRTEQGYEHANRRTHGVENGAHVLEAVRYVLPAAAQGFCSTCPSPEYQSQQATGLGDRSPNPSAVCPVGPTRGTIAPLCLCDQPTAGSRGGAVDTMLRVIRLPSGGRPAAG